MGLKGGGAMGPLVSIILMGGGKKAFDIFFIAL